MDSDFIKAIFIFYLLETIIDSLNDQDKKVIHDNLDKMRKE